MSREDCYGALFALLSGLKENGTVKLCSRRLRFLEEMAASELPALFMGVDHGQVTPQPNGPPRRTLGAKVFLYAANPDRRTPAGIVLNTLVDTVEDVLRPPPAEERQTLSGRVRHAWIEGTIEVFEGPGGERAAAIIAIQMLIP